MSEPLQVQLVADAGANDPIVARTMLQAFDLLDPLDVTRVLHDPVGERMQSIMLGLLAIKKIAMPLAKSIRESSSTLQSQGAKRNGIGHDMPSVPNLQHDAEMILYKSKLVLRDIGDIVKPFFGVSFGFNVAKLADWASKHFATEAQFADIVRKFEPMAQRVCDMRNAVEHPETASLKISDFRLRRIESGTLTFTEPLWQLNNDLPSPIGTEVLGILQFLLEYSEILLVTCIRNFDFGLKVQFRIVEIPIEYRNPTIPQRFALEFKL